MRLPREDVVRRQEVVRTAPLTGAGVSVEHRIPPLLVSPRATLVLGGRFLILPRCEVATPLRAVLGGMPATSGERSPAVLTGERRGTVRCLRTGRAAGRDAVSWCVDEGLRAAQAHQRPTGNAVAVAGGRDLERLTAGEAVAGHVVADEFHIRILAGLERLSKMGLTPRLEDGG